MTIDLKQSARIGLLHKFEREIMALNRHYLFRFGSIVDRPMRTAGASAIRRTQITRCPDELVRSIGEN